MHINGKHIINMGVKRMTGEYLILIYYNQLSRTQTENIFFSDESVGNSKIREIPVFLLKSVNNFLN